METYFPPLKGILWKHINLSEKTISLSSGNTFLTNGNA